MRSIRWLRAALVEQGEALDYYAAIDLDLAADFEHQVRSTFALFDRFGGAGMRIDDVGGTDVRRFLTHQFPYAVVMARFDDEIVVVAVHHQRRAPGYWKPRLANVRR